MEPTAASTSAGSHKQGHQGNHRKMQRSESSRGQSAARKLEEAFSMKIHLLAGLEGLEGPAGGGGGGGVGGC